ncbi:MULTISPECIES: FG-GAP-like repeat-containing protein [unclassified Streptomyces]|uniref:FG-GAP-like repeat-containing protein n=1 Tax=unclassified Streptomyces TaxID=2593676 RepID=UPI0006B06816|nr:MULTISPECIES: FG-GAP-like repeat-containing protein [unclassified Streptomyces]
MNSVRASRRRLTTAVTTVLAITLGAGLLAAPATAAPAAASFTAAAGATTPIADPGGSLLGAGRAGFLNRALVGDTHQLRWTTYADGTTTTLPATGATRAEVFFTETSDIVMTSEEGRWNGRSQHITLRNMTTGAAPVDVDFTELGADYRFAGLVGDTLFATGTNEDGAKELLLLDATGDTRSARKVSGLPEGALIGSVRASRSGTALLDIVARSETASDSRLTMVDVATATAGPAHSVLESSLPGSTHGLSDTHAAWSEGTGSTVTLAIADRTTEKVRRVSVGKQLDGGTDVGVLGTWVTYGTPIGLDRVMDSPPVDVIQALTARSATTDETVRLLDHMTGAVPAPDGTLLVHGGLVGTGEGLYRIALGEDGRPTAELVASEGRPTELTYLGTDLRTLDLDADPAKTHLKWRMSRVNADVYLKLTHRRSGEAFELKMHLYRESAGAYTYDDQTFGLSWAEVAAKSKLGKAPYSGTYDWSFRAVPQNGIGPDLKASGEFYAKRTADPHDLNDNHTPDLLARDAEGDVWQIDTAYDTSTKTLTAAAPRRRAGVDWDAYDRIESIGNTGGEAGDFVARDKSGALWIHHGAGPLHSEALTPRWKVGGGWNTYTELTGGSDLTGDKTPDLVAVDTAGDLYLYESTGTTPAPFAPREKIGHSWGIYDQITATGDIGGAPAGDLVARDKDGKLWLYLGKGDGTFAARTLIGGGWGPYTDIVGIGDADGDGRPDLYARGTGNTSYFYAGTGNWKAPFKARAVSPVLGTEPDVPYNKVF